MENVRFIKDDSRWIRQMFMTDPNSYDDFLRSKRTATEDFYKFEDTTLGGHRTMNPPPQYTRYCDLKGERLLSGISRGMGEYYSEAIDSNARVISMRFGVPEYSGLVSFFNNFYNTDAAMLVKTGKSGGIFYTAGKLAGYVAVLPFLPFIVVGGYIKYLAGAQNTKFYYLRPTMPVYWNAVQTMLNGIAANMGLTPPQENDEIMVAKRDANGMPVKNAAGNIEYDDLNFNIPGSQFSEFAKLIPDVWRGESGGIDVYSISTRAQRLANIWNDHLSQIATDSSIINDELWRQRILSYPGHTHREMIAAIKGTPLQAAMQRWFDSPAGGMADAAASEQNANAADLKKDSGIIDRFSSYLLAELRDGAQFVSFYVHGSGTATESFSNSTRTPDLGEKFNSISSGVRMARINVADGKSGLAVVDSLVGAATDLIKGAIDGIQMSGLLALAGNAFTDIPKVWEASTANLPRCDYTIQLRTPYGNKLSRFQNLLVPLCMLLAGTLPRSTGSQSYGSPFIMELYDKGRAQSRLCIIESLTVTRGVGNIGWTKDDEPLGIDVSFSVADLSSIMHMPQGTSTGTLFTPGGINRAFFGDETAYSDYVAILSSLSLADQIYKTRRLARNWRKMKLDFDSFFSVSHAASWFGGTAIGSVLSGLSNIRSNG